MSEENDNEIELETKGERSLKKFWFVLIMFNLAFLVIIIRLFIIQIYDAERFAARAKHQHESKIELRAERGKIFDRNGRLIASTINSLSIAVDPKLLAEKLIVCKALERATGLSFRHFLKKINSSKNSFVWMIRGIMPDKAKELDTLNYRGLIKFKEPKRNFLYGDVGSQIVGATNIDNKGISGIEMAYDSILTGISGYMIMQRDAIGRLSASADLPLIPPIHGKSIELTIDIELQRIVEYELKKAVEIHNAASGTVIALEPESGEVLAIASYPTYNPNDLSQRSGGGMKIKAITDVYEPGSTFKLVTAASALEEGAITPNSIVNGFGGVLSFGQYSIRDDHPVGIVTFAEAFEKSSNVVFAQVADMVPTNKYYKYIRDFGFGNTLGIDINGEVKGRMPKPKQFLPFTKRYISHGYGVSATALQMLEAYAIVANGGELMRPFVVKKIYDSKGEIITEVESQKIRRVISEETAKTLTDMLCLVVENGTGKSARIRNVKIGGKTGTSQQIVGGRYSKQFYTGSFAGFFPADDPKIAIIVIIDRPTGIYYGGLTAAPVFNNIAKRWIAINPELSKKSYDFTVIDTVTVPSVKGFFSVEALKVLRDFGFRPTLNNLQDGIIVKQDPPAGSILHKGSEVRIFAQKYQTLISDTLDSKIGKLRSYPDVVGFSLKKAIAILHKSGIKVRISGSGVVAQQTWSRNDKGELVCTVHCN